MVNTLLILAFGFSIGINPPIDFHLPNSEELYNEWQEKEEERNDPSYINDPTKDDYKNTEE